MDKIIIAKMGIEERINIIYSQRVNDVWSFWREEVAIDLDENDNKSWLHSESPHVIDLLDALPKIWWRMIIYHVHSDFEQQLRQAFAQYNDHPDWDEHRFNPPFQLQQKYEWILADFDDVSPPKWRAMLKKHADFFQFNQIELFYTAENIYIDSFWDFMTRCQSLQRYWQFHKSKSQDYTSIMRKAHDDFMLNEVDDVDPYADDALTDIEYFPEFVRLTTITIALSLVENMLSKLSDEVAKDLGTSIKFEQSNLPYINKYLYWLTHNCGLMISVDEDILKSINTVRRVRNSFIHQMSKDMPDNIRKMVHEMLETIDENSPVNNEFVDVALKKLAELVKTIELAYIKFYEKTKKE